MKKNTFIITSLVCLLLPAIALASSGGIVDYLTSFGGIVKLVIPVSCGVAVLYFLWGVAQSILHADEEDARREGRQKMLWGVIAIAVIFSIAGIIALLNNIFFSNGSGTGSDPGSLPCFVSGTVGDEGGPCTGN